MTEQNDSRKALSIQCSRPSHLYHPGEEAEFSLRGKDGLAVEVEFSADGGEILRTEQVTLPAVLRQTLSRPGFLRCRISAPGEGSLLCAAAFDPEAIRPAAPPPPDFDAFWKKAGDQFEKMPEDLKLEPCAGLNSQSHLFYDVSCSNWNGEKVYGLLRLPKASGTVPLLVYFEGAGPGQSLETFQDHCGNSDRHLGTGIAALTICTHHFKPGRTQAEHRKLYEDYLKKIGVSYWLEGLEKVDFRNSFFYRMILGASRLCDLVCRLPEINPKRIAYLGASQGGGFGLYLTAMCPQIKAAFCGVPAFGDFAGGKNQSHQPQSNIKDMNRYVDKLQYFDAAYFARNIKVPVFISLGYIDTACCPSSVMAIANSLGGPKLVFHKVENGHGDAPVEYNDLTWFWVRQHLEHD